MRTILLILITLLTVTSLVLGVVLFRNDNSDKGDTERDWSETGVYYHEAGGVNYELTLAKGGSFTLKYGEESETGSYSLNGNALTLDFYKESKDDIEGTYENGVVTLTVDGAVLRMLKKVNYTVSFESNGGSAVTSVTVLNGKTLVKPLDPVRDGYLFVGWYKDSEFKKPFTFLSDVITSDTVLHARWVEKQDKAREYTVSFDLSYDGAEPLEPRTTVGARLFDVLPLERSGYKFGGWWISTDNDPSRPSYVYSEDTVFTSDTTLYAVWYADGSTKLEYPSIQISDDTISWSHVEGTRSYDVTVLNSLDEVVFSKENITENSVSVLIKNYLAGVYKIKVVANAKTVPEDNSESFYTLVHKQLDKVEDLFVSGDSMFVFEGVEKAEKYLITVVCGNSEHNHTDFDNGASTNFSFANCIMTDSGIRFTVKAVADGYLTSVSDEFVYKRELVSVDGLAFDTEQCAVEWKGVENAEYYKVLVTCGDSSHEHNVTDAFISLKECSPLSGGITVKVYPVADGYISPEAAEIKVDKTNIRTPSGITVIGNVLSWSNVAEASKYEVSVNGETKETLTSQLDLSSVCQTAGAEYTLSVRAIGATSSLWSEPLVVTFGSMGDVSYSKNSVVWTPVVGADFYEVQVGEADIVKVDGGVCSLKIALYKSGVNAVKVRFVKGSTASAWKTVSVTAHSLTFDTLGGNAVSAMFFADGDFMTLSASAKTGYSFVNWYNVPGGPSANGKKITDSAFNFGEDTVLYAHYKPNKYEITYNYGVGGTGLGVNGVVEYGRDFVLEMPVHNEPTVAFGGWFSAPYGSGTQYTDGGGNSLSPWTHLGGMELYAFWIDQTLTFSAVKVNGKDVYAVSAGPRISLVTNVTVPAYHNGLPVAMIDANAFKDCKNLAVINLPATVEVVSTLDPFSGCSSLTEINVYAVDGITATRYSSDSGVLFENISDGSPALLKMPVGISGEYTVPYGTGEISTVAFADSCLTSVTVPASVTKIGNDAFANCKNLESVTFAATLYAEDGEDLTIGKRAFSGCVSLSKITLPARLTSIELSKYYLNSDGAAIVGTDHAFVGCDSLATLEVESGSKSYKVVSGMIYSADGKNLLYCPEAMQGELSIPIGTQSIAAGAFIGCDALTEIFIPNTVTYIDRYAFYSLGITKVTFEGEGLNKVTIGDNAFKGCESLAEVEIGTGSAISVIGAGAFSGCTSLETFSIPSAITSIRDRAFENCESLSSVTFGAKRNSDQLEFGKDVFLNCKNLTSITLPAYVSEIPGIFGGCTSLTEIKVEPANPNFESVDGVIYNKDKTAIIFYPQGRVGSYQIPEGVKTIANGVFSGNSFITELKIPNTVSYIGEEAFKNSGIGKIVFYGDDYADELIIGRAAFMGAKFEDADGNEDIFTLPAHTKEIGEYAFSGIFFKSIILNEGLEILGDYAFYIPSNDDGYVNIPASVVSIGKYCFSREKFEDSRFVKVTFTKENSRLETIGDFAFYQNTTLTEIDLPDSVKTIGNYAFYECTGVTSLSLPASLEVIGAYAFAASHYEYKLLIDVLNIPANVREIGAHAFEYCFASTVNFMGTADSPDLIVGSTYLRSYTQDGIEMTAVERGSAFANCSKLTTVNLSPNVTVLGDSCFLSAGSAADDVLTVNVPSDSRLTTIGAYCFLNSKLQSFTVPATVRNLDPTEEYGVIFNRFGIGDYAFASERNGYLTSVTFLKSTDNYPLTIGQGAFMNQKLQAVELPSRLSTYTSADGVIAPLADDPLVFYGNRNLATITVEQGTSAYYTVYEGVLYTADMTKLVFCPVLKSGVVNVPDTVTEICANAFRECSAVTSVTFGQNSALTKIGEYAFYYSSITDMVFPTNVSFVGEAAFNNCKNLENITLSKKLVSFDVAALDGCTALKNVYVESGNTSYLSAGGVLYSFDKSSLILYPLGKDAKEYSVLLGVVTIEPSAFMGNTTLESVILPVGLREIKDNAFAGCSSLKTLVIPNTVELIGAEAFASLVSLESLTFEKGGTAKLVISDGAFRSLSAIAVELPARIAAIGNEAFFGAGITELTFEPASVYVLTEIGDKAFGGTSLVNVTLPDGIVTVGSGIFSETKVLESVTFGDGLETLGSEAFKNSWVTTVSLPASLKFIGENAFNGCRYLASVTFADNCKLEVISSGAFSGCSSLQSIVIPASVSEIGGASENGAFYNCSSLESVIFESRTDCHSIGAYAFAGCSKLSSFELPVSVGTLGNYAFMGCSSLTEISIPRATTDLGDNLFEGCTSLASVELNTGASLLPANMFKDCSSLTDVYIPANISEIGKNCFSGAGIEEFRVAENNRNFVSVSGVLYNYSKTEIVCFPPNSRATTLVIPKEVVSIPAENFRGNLNIKDVIFEEGGTTPLAIGNSAFRECRQLRSIQLPERLVSIGERAFQDCYNLTSITIPNNVTKIQNNVFTYCYKLTEICNLSSLDIKDFGIVSDVLKNLNVITDPSDSILSREGDYLFATKNGSKTLIGYMGNDSEMVLPTGTYSFVDWLFAYNTTLKRVVIPNPAGITISTNTAFSNCGNIEAIYVTGTVPSSWDVSWSGIHTVVQDYSGNDITYTFVTGDGEYVAPVTSKFMIALPTPVRAGYIFDGWYDNAEFSGDAVSANYYSTSKTTLYAKFLTESEYIEQYLRGQSMEYAYEVESGSTYGVNIKVAKDQNYYVITVEKGEKWHIQTVGSRHMFWIYDESGRQIAEIRPNGYNIDDVYTFSKAGTYYVGIGYYVDPNGNSSKTGTFEVTFTKQ